MNSNGTKTEKQKIGALPKYPDASFEVINRAGVVGWN
jgi:hypothetical protein